MTATDPTPGRRVVVTGGAGFIGSHVVDTLLSQGAEVHVVDDLSTGRRARVADAATFHRIDISDSDALRELATSHGPFQAWYHLAAQADVRVSVAEPLVDARTNVLGTISVLEAARIDGAGVTFSSTGGAIYGEAEPPSDEDTRERPESPYGAAKLAAEKYVETHARLYGLPHAILRYANVYGPRQDPHGEAGVVAIFGGKILRGETATIYGDGRQTRDYVFVHDVVAATLAASTAARPVQPGGDVPVYNVGTGVETSVLDLWSAMCHAAGVDLPYELKPLRAGELQRSALDASRARQELGVAFDTDLVEGLRATIDWQRDDMRVGSSSH